MTDFTPEQKLALIKHLAAGKPTEVVATIMHTTRDQVIDVARGHGYPDTEKLAWAADILAKKLEEDPGGINTAPLAEGGIVVRTKAEPEKVVPISQPRTDDVMAMLNKAKGHPSKRIQSAAEKAMDAISRVRQLVVEDEQKHHERRKAEQAKAAARAEVKRLEAELAAAKAKLRGTATATNTEKPAATRPADKATAPRGEFPCRNDGCTEVKDTPQGRSMHERMHCPHRAQEAS